MSLKMFSCLKGGTIKAIFLVCLAVGVVGLLRFTGDGVWISTLVLLLFNLCAAGASDLCLSVSLPAAVIHTGRRCRGLLVNARHIPFGVTVRDLVGRRAASFIGCHIMNDESVVFGLSQPTPEQRKAAFWLCGWRGAFLAAGYTFWRHDGQTLTRTGNHRPGCGFPAILLALVVPAFKNRTLKFEPVAVLRYHWLACLLHPLGYRCCFHCLVCWRGKNNGKHDAVYRRYRHFVGWHLFNASWRREAGESLSLFGTLAGAALRCRNGTAFPSHWPPPFMKVSTFRNGARARVSFAVFLAWRKAPLIVVIFAAAIVTALPSGGYTLKERLWALIPYSFFYWLT
jgi:predicted branched-subunit amino acid permease